VVLIVFLMVGTMSRICVAVASPNDVPEEREIVPKVCLRYNDLHPDVDLHPLMWEHSSTPSVGDNPQAILNRDIIERSELLIAIFWTRLGTPTPSASSGTVEEIREFIKLKGPGRVMLYFCNQRLPYDVDFQELERLRQFRDEVKSQSLYWEYTTPQDFERDLTQHVPAKVRKLLNGELPLPTSPVTVARDPTFQHGSDVDPRLKVPLDFGSTVQNISSAFTTRMQTFRSLSAGPDKFRNLAAHVYTSVAICLDRYLTYSASSLDSPARAVIKEVSTGLKRLVACIDDYNSKAFNAYWDDGEKLASDLAVQVAHLQRLKKI